MKILFIVAHPDDEVIGCGGTIAYHIKRKDDVKAISFTNGTSSRHKNDNSISDISNIRKKSYVLASKILNFKWIANFNYPDNELDTVSKLTLIKEIEKIASKFNPDIVYTHHTSDLNIDHQIISTATLTAFRPTIKKKHTEIRFFETPSSTDYTSFKIDPIFKPNLYIDISKFWNKKHSALLAYKQEMMKYPSSRSLKGIKNLAEYRGNSVGVKLAEAFEVVRKVVS